MLENKFRGQTENGQWIYGGVAYYNSIASNRAYIVDHLQLIPVKPDTICQFTNYCDCNHNEIYEGDIVENEDGERRLVYKIEGGYALGEPPIVESAELYDCFFTDIIPSYLKVIGNKFDNPDILEAQHERD